MAPSHELLIDGSPVDVFVVDYYTQLEIGSVEALTEEAAGLLRKLSLEEASKCFDVVYFPITPPLGEVVDEVAVWFPDPKRVATVDVHFRIQPRLEEWAKPWSLAALAQVVDDSLANHPFLRPLEEEPGFDGWRDWESGISFFLPIPFRPTLTLQDIWDEALPIGLTFVRGAIARLAGGDVRQPESVERLFEFPTSVRAACEQYLLYFVQFLRDLDIEADAGLTEAAGRVLFSVTPRSAPEALGKIREALDAYLALPDNPQVFNDRAPKDVAVQQLSANVFHLKGQLELASALIGAKNAQIEALRLSNMTLSRYALPSPTPDRQLDEEPLVDGIVAITPYETKGVRINLPEILRRLKRRFD